MNKRTKAVTAVMAVTLSLLSASVFAQADVGAEFGEEFTGMCIRTELGELVCSVPKGRVDALVRSVQERQRMPEVGYCEVIGGVIICLV